MKTLKTIFAASIIATSFICLDVNAETKYAGDKKYTITESDTYIDSLYKIDDKIYAQNYNFETFETKMGLLEFKNEKYTISSYLSEEEQKNKLSSISDNNFYYNLDGNVLQKIKYNINTNAPEIKEEYTLKEFDVNNELYMRNSDDKNVYLYDEANNILYKYTVKGELEQKLVISDFIKKLDIDFKEDDHVYAEIIFDEKDESYLTLHIETYNEGIKNKYVNATFDLKGNLIHSFVDTENKVMDGAETRIINKEVIYNYSYCEEEYKKCSYIIQNGDNKKTVMTSDNYVYGYTIDGFNIVIESAADTEKYSTKQTFIYDQDFNLITSYENLAANISGLYDKNTFASNQVITKVQNGMYLISVAAYNQLEDKNELEKSYIMFIEDSKKVDITGYVKDKDGNPLKDITVELHSTPRTVTTDENGYFKFEKVEEGDHTLTIKDKDGKVLATKEIKVLEGNETKLDGDTLYFNLEDKGMNLNIKLDGDKLSIDSIDKGIKEPVKQNTPSVPKTYDSLTNSIIMLITLLFSTFIVIKKLNKQN